MTKKLTKIIALTIGFINILLHGYHLGFELGSSVNSGIYSTFGSGYQFLAKCYLYLFIFSLIFVVSNIIKKKLIFHIVSLSLLALMIFQYQKIYLQKSLFIENTNIFTKLIRETIIIDYTSLSLVLILIVLQFIIIYYDYFQPNQRLKIRHLS